MYQTDNDLFNRLQSQGYANANGGLKSPTGGASSGMRGNVPVSVSAQDSVAGVGNGADTTMDVLFSAVLNAKTLGTKGDYVDIHASGTFAATANNKRVQLKFGGTVVADTGVVTDNNKAWRLMARVTWDSAAKQVAGGNAFADTAMATTNAAPTEDETAAITVAVLGGSTTTGAASDVLANSFHVTVTPAAA